MLPTIKLKKIVDIRRKRAREEGRVRHGSENGHCFIKCGCSSGW
jgi:hypothetical protein